MTSPWLAVLTSSPTMTFTPNSRGLLRRLERAGDLVVVGDGDRAEPLLARGREQHLDRRRAVVASGRCACAGRRRSSAGPRAARRTAGRRAARWRRAASAGVDGLELVGDARRSPAARAALAPPRRSARAQRARRRPGARAGRRGLDVARLEQQAALALADELLVDRQPRRERHGAGGDARAAAAPGAGAAPSEARDDDVGGAQHALEPAPSRPGKRTRSRSVGAQRRRRRGPAVGQTRASHGSAVSRRRSARRNEPQRGALLLVDEDDAHAASSGRGARGGRVDAGRTTR